MIDVDGKLSVVWKIGLLFAGSAAYAAIRYVVFQPDHLHHVPLFIANKAISMGAAFSFAIAFWHQRGTRRSEPGGEVPCRSDAWLRAGVVGSLIHILMSVNLLRPGYFEEFFQSDQRMTGSGELIVALGAFAAGLLYLLTRRQINSLIRHPFRS